METLIDMSDFVFVSFFQDGDDDRKDKGNINVYINPIIYFICCTKLKMYLKKKIYITLWIWVLNIKAHTKQAIDLEKSELYFKTGPFHCTSLLFLNKLILLNLWFRQEKERGGREEEDCRPLAAAGLLLLWPKPHRLSDWQRHRGHHTYLGSQTLPGSGRILCSIKTVANCSSTVKLGKE